jgi:hypothetical protein
VDTPGLNGCARCVGVHGLSAERSDPGIEIVQFNPKVVRYDVFGPAATTANINYWDADANTHQISAAPVPWSYTFSTVYPSVSANIMVQGDGVSPTIEG